MAYYPRKRSNRRTSFPKYKGRKNSWVRLTAAAEYKHILKKRGQLYCWVCGWFDPTTLPFFLIEMHHCIQVSNNGTHDYSNLLPCCPNCHRIADRISKANKNLKLTIPVLIAMTREHEYARNQRVSRL